MKTLLVTGATSFVGRNLLPALQEQYDIVCVVRPSEPARSQLDFAPTAEVVSADLADPQFARRLPERADAVLHMAVAPPSLAPEPSQAFQVNAASALALLEWGKRAKIERFMFTSSGSVYAAQPAPITEDTAPRPADLLGVAKYAAEMAVELYRREFPSVILRIWRPYGPGQGENFLIPRLAARIRMGLPVTLNRGGGPRANTIYISDMVEVMRRALTLDRPATLNAAHHEAPSIWELCRELEQVLGCPGQYEWRDAESSNLIADVSRMQETLGYRPAVSLREGLRMTFGAKE
jgi:nucleoside-diphosphate-sugar epimerase